MALENFRVTHLIGTLKCFFPSQHGRRRILKENFMEFISETRQCYQCQFTKHETDVLLEGPFSCSIQKTHENLCSFGFCFETFNFLRPKNSQTDLKCAISTDCIPEASCSFMLSWSGFQLKDGF